MRPGTVVGSIFLGIFGFLLAIILIPLGALIMLVAFILFIYGLVASPPAPPAPPASPVSYAPSVMTLCPQCKTPVAVDSNYCSKCGADMRSRTKEIVKEKEVIVKIRCSYCGTLYNETLDRCPHCGAKR